MNMAQQIEIIDAIDDNINDMHKAEHNVMTLGKVQKSDVETVASSKQSNQKGSSKNDHGGKTNSVGMTLTKNVAELVSKLWQIQPLETMPNTSVSNMLMLTEMAKQDKIKNYDSAYTGWTHYSSFNAISNWGFWTKDKAEKPEDKGYSGIYTEKVKGMEVENQTGRFSTILQPQLSPLGLVLQGINSLPLNDNIRQTTASSPGSSDWQSFQWLGTQINALPENWVDEVPLLRLLLMSGTNIKTINPFIEDRVAYKWNNFIGSKGDVVWTTANGVYDAANSVDSVQAICMMMDTFVSVATGKAAIANYGPSTWGSSTAVIPVKAVDAGRWLIPFTFAYLDTLTYNMMTQYGVVLEGDNWEELVANTLATTIRVRGPYERVLFVIIDGTSKQPATHQWRWGGAAQTVNVNIWVPNAVVNAVDLYPTFRSWLGVGVAPLPTVSNDIGIAWRNMCERSCMGEMAWNAVALASELMFKDWIISHGCLMKTNGAPLDETAEHKIMAFADEMNRVKEDRNDKINKFMALNLLEEIENENGIFTVYDDIFDFLERFRELLHDECLSEFDLIMERISENIDGYECEEEAGSEKIAKMDVSDGLLDIIRMFFDKKNGKNRVKIKGISREYPRYEAAVYWCLQNAKTKNSTTKNIASSTNESESDSESINSRFEEYDRGNEEHGNESLLEDEWSPERVDEYNGENRYDTNDHERNDDCTRQDQKDQDDRPSTNEPIPNQTKSKRKKNKNGKKNTCGSKPVPYKSGKNNADDADTSKSDNNKNKKKSGAKEEYHGMSMDPNDKLGFIGSDTGGKSRRSIMYRSNITANRLRADPINLAWYNINSIKADLTANFKNHGATYVRGTAEAEKYSKDIVVTSGKYYKGRYGLTKEKEDEWLPDMRACWVSNTIARVSPMKRNFGTIWNVKKPDNLLPHRSIAKSEKQNTCGIAMHRSQEASALWRLMTHAGLVMVNNNYPNFRSGRAAFVFCKGVAMLMGASFENILHDCSLPAAKAAGMTELINREEGLYDVCWISTEGRVCDLRAAREGWIASGGKDSDGRALTNKNYIGWKRIFTGTIPWWQRKAVIGKFGIVAPVPDPEDKYSVETTNNDVEYLGRKVKHSDQWALESQLSESLNTNMLLPAAWWWFDDIKVRVGPAMDMDLLIDHNMAKQNMKTSLPEYEKLTLPNSYPIILPRMYNALTNCNYHAIWISANTTPSGIGYTRTDWNWPDPLIDWLKWGLEGALKVVPHMLMQDWAGAALAAGSHIVGGLADWLRAKSSNTPVVSNLNTTSGTTITERMGSGISSNDAEN